ncbi:hypothetical protein RHMOL_Rhmol13G0217000 [Rhododendron molle]|uniref:Uncharacterized protein n=1 Tax=Rhododendron molle TaxID=49168 RepID=A0ACC0LAU9_RHOML|nr:hypothetical protein RHMOL_Rhmol13G0217000 [Rhododendron molle]
MSRERVSGERVWGDSRERWSGGVQNFIQGEFSTVFVDNLPLEIRKVWIFNLFSKFGQIREPYIPLKRSKISRNRFAFVRFNKREEAAHAIAQINGSWVWGHKLVVNFARFQKKIENNLRDARPPYPNIKEAAKSGHLAARNQIFPPNPKSNQPKTYTDAVKQVKEKKKVHGNKEVSNQKFRSVWVKKKMPIKAREYGNEWLHRSAVAKLSSSRPIMLIQDYLRNLGHAHVLVRHMGGDSIVLTFNDVEERDSMFNGGKMSWLRDWFIESFKWEDSMLNPCSRLVLLNCYGVPLQLWNCATFSKIGQIWGDVVLIADDTIKSLSFSVGKVLISTKEMDLINQTIELESKRKIWKIRIIEEQMVVNTILRTDCACPGCHVDSSSQIPSAGDSKEQPLNNGGEDNVDANLDLVEEVAETVGSKMDNDPRDPGPILDDLAPATSKENNVGLQLIPFSGNINDKHAVRDSRGAEHACFLRGMGTVSSMEVNNVHVQLLNLKVGHQNIIGPSKTLFHPITSFSLNPLVPNALSQGAGHESSLSIAPYNKTFQAKPIDGSIEPSVPIVEDEVIPKESRRPKKKLKSVEDILGFKPKPSRKGGRRSKQKCVVFRSAIAAAALSVSSEGINNRNRILLNEAQAVWSVTKIMETDYLGNDEEVISKIMGEEGAMMILSWNVRGLGMGERRNKVKRWSTNRLEPKFLQVRSKLLYEESHPGESVVVNNDELLSQVLARKMELQKWDFLFRRNLYDWESVNLDELNDLLDQSGVAIPRDAPDQLLWQATSSGKFSVKSIYNLAFSSHSDHDETFELIWKNVAQPKVKCFSWLAYLGRIKTAEFC